MTTCPHGVEHSRRAGVQCTACSDAAAVGGRLAGAAAARVDHRNNSAAEGE